MLKILQTKVNFLRLKTYDVPQDFVTVLRCVQRGTVRFRDSSDWRAKTPVTAWNRAAKKPRLLHINCWRFSENLLALLLKAQAACWMTAYIACEQPALVKSMDHKTTTSMNQINGSQKTTTSILPRGILMIQLKLNWAIPDVCWVCNTTMTSGI